jgi:hypothetical protein
VPRPWERYAWLRDSDLEAFCISVATRGDVDRLAAIFGADRSSETTATFFEAWHRSIDEDEDGGANDVVQIGELDGCVVATEPNGWTGADEGVAAEASRGGRYVSFYRSVNADMRLVVAIDGVAVREFDPLLYEPDIDPGEPLAEEGDLPFGDPDDCETAAFVLIERLTGVRVTAEWLLNERRPAFRRSDR